MTKNIRCPLQLFFRMLDICAGGRYINCGHTVSQGGRARVSLVAHHAILPLLCSCEELTEPTIRRDAKYFVQVPSLSGGNVKESVFDRVLTVRLKPSVFVFL